MQHRDNDNDLSHDGLDTAGSSYLISDRDLDRLAEADEAFARWESTQRWWRCGDLTLLAS